MKTRAGSRSRRLLNLEVATEPLCAAAAEHAELLSRETFVRPEGGFMNVCHVYNVLGCSEGTVTSFKGSVC